MIGGIGGGSHTPSPTPQPHRPASWDMDQLERDTKEVVRDPSKTILIPYDGGQPRVVPNPDPPENRDD